MTAIVAAGYLQDEELQKAFNHFIRPGVYLFIETLTDLQIQIIDTIEQIELQKIHAADYETGRMFDSEFEVRWQRLRGFSRHIPPFQVRVMCDHSAFLADFDFSQWQTSGGNAAIPQPLTQTNGDAFYLWGEPVTNEAGQPMGAWYEKEVPRIFNYPVDNDQRTRRVQIISKIYRLSQEIEEVDSLRTEYGEDFLLLHRFTGMLGIEE